MTHRYVNVKKVPEIKLWREDKKERRKHKGRKRGKVAVSRSKFCRSQASPRHCSLPGNENGGNDLSVRCPHLLIASSFILICLANLVFFLKQSPYMGVRLLPTLPTKVKSHPS